MNKIRLFKIKCVVLSILLLSSQVDFTMANNSISRITLEQTIKEKMISVNVKNQSIKNILYEIQKQSGISFAIKDQEYADKLDNLSLQVKNMSIEKALDILLTKTDFTYLIVNDAINIVKRSEKQQIAKKFTIKGKVIDGSTKRPITGATVLILGTNSGSITDNHGNYSLTASIGQSIEVSFVGMKPFTKKIDAEISELNITLQLDQMNIDNVVITGQANISKNSFTGNAKTVSGEDLLKVSRTNVIKALQAFDPSFRMAENLQFGSDPNALPEVYIRGRSSLGSFELDTDALSKNNLNNNPNTPTFIMDGFEVSIQKVYDLDPNRIQSMTILKDAAATAMYGSRAANGVVVITTVPITGDAVRVNYNLTTTLEIPDLSDYNLMNAKEILETERLGGAFHETNGDFIIHSYWKKWNEIYIEGVETDWLSQPLRNAFKHKHSLTVDGGSGNVRYGVSMKYTGDDGVMKNSNRNNTGAELYIQGNFGGLNIRNTVSFGTTWINESNYGSFADYTHKLPYSKYMDEKGNYPRELKDGALTKNRFNPLYEANLASFDKSNYEEFINNFDVRWNLNEYLRVTGQISYTKTWNKGTRFVDPLSKNSTYDIEKNMMLAGDLFDRSDGSSKVNSRVGVSYNRTVGKNNINFTINGELIQNKSNSRNTNYVGFATGIKPSINSAAGIDGRPISGESTSRSVGVTGIFNYSFDNIYLADLSLRYEGSSMFGENQKGAPFGSIGLGINIHNYEFMRNVTAISRLKVRGTYGQVGNINFPPYAAQNYYKMMVDDWYPTGFGTKIEYIGNPDLKMEKTHNLDLGIDLSFWQDRLTFVASYYNKTTKDMINDVTIPSSSGFKVYKDNFGKVRNEGYELELYANVVRRKDWSITVNANLASNKNTLLEIGESLKNYNERVDEHYTGAGSSPDQTYSKPFRKFEEGGSMTSIFGMRSLGIDPMTGNDVFLDRNGNVLYKWLSSQQTIIGNTEPIAQGSFGLNARYKNFTLYASFSYEFGGQRYNQTLIDHVENVIIGETNLDKRVLTDRWQKPGDVAPLKNIKDRTTTLPTSRFVQDYNVLSLNSVSIQYEFSDAIAKKMYMERLRIEASCNELFRCSSVKQERGLSYPFARTFNVSLMVNF